MHIHFQRPLHHWNYYLSIEADLEAISKYVELVPENYKTFSVQFTKIIIEACSEVDVLLNQISKVSGLTKKKPNFGDHFPLVRTHASTLLSEVLEIPNYGIVLNPFQEWNEGREPNWHKVYNSLKHHRCDHYRNGNLENALLSVAALFTTSIHYYQCIVSSKFKNGCGVALCDVVTSLAPKSHLIRYNNELHRFIKLD